MVSIEMVCFINKRREFLSALAVEISWKLSRITNARQPRYHSMLST